MCLSSQKKQRLHVPTFRVYRDLAVYQDAISEFGIPSLVDRFEMLRQLGNLL